jgi:hypothetical protein
LNDSIEHLTGVAALCRCVAVPDLGVVTGEDVGKIGAGRFHAVRCERRDIDGARPLVAVLDEQPAAARLPGASTVAAAGAHKHPRPLQFEPIQPKLQVTLFERGVHVVTLRLPRAPIPEHDDARAIAFRDHALERAVLNRVILNVHRKALVRCVQRRPLRHSPR